MARDGLTQGKTFELKSDGKQSTMGRTGEEHSRQKKQQVQRPCGRACLRKGAGGSQGREMVRGVVHKLGKDHHARYSPQAEVGCREVEAELHPFFLSLKSFIR